MKKLRLDLDNLKVDSFATTPEALHGRGTVVGQNTEYETCMGATCFQQGGGGCQGESTPQTCGMACSGACTQEGHSCNGYTECCASTVACGSIDTFDCGGCHDTNYDNSCTDQGCSACANAC